jgi:hypothetical protein
MLRRIYEIVDFMKHCHQIYAIGNLATKFTKSENFDC